MVHFQWKNHFENPILQENSVQKNNYKSIYLQNFVALNSLCNLHKVQTLYLFPTPVILEIFVYIRIFSTNEPHPHESLIAFQGTSQRFATMNSLKRIFMVLKKGFEAQDI